MKKVLAGLILLVCAVSACAQTMDVPRDHWAYDAVKELANEGYVLGYPDGSFLGNRSLTRYEFATIIKRILDNVDTKITAVDSKASQRPAATAPATQPGVTPEVTAQDLNNIKKLVDEFKVELTVIGTRVEQVEAAVEELKSQVDTIDAVVNDPEGAVQTVISDVSKLKQVKMSGYVQTRYQMYDFTKEDNTEDESTDTLYVRRARWKATYAPTNKSTGVLQLDLGKSGIAVKNAYFNYAFGENSSLSPSFQIGLFDWYFGYEVPYSSSRRETPERALFVRRFFPGEYDTGAVLMGPSEGSFQWLIGAYNGTGVDVGSTGATDQNDNKDLFSRLKWGIGDLDFGISGYYGKGVWTSFKNLTYDDSIEKVRYGADFQYFMNNMTFKAEYIRGRGFDDVAASPIQNKWIDGYYAQIGYNLNTYNTFVARYASMSEDPKKPLYGRRSAWDLGIIHWLDSSSNLKLFYKINTEEFNEIDDNDGFTAEWIVTY